jgi:hypothetical protein
MRPRNRSLKTVSELQTILWGAHAPRVLASAPRRNTLLFTDTAAKGRNREGAITSTRGACTPRIQSLRSASFDRNDFRTRYRTDAIASTIPLTANSRIVACVRIQMIAAIASAGTIFAPGKLKG